MPSDKQLEQWARDYVAQYGTPCCISNEVDPYLHKVDCPVLNNPTALRLSLLLSDLDNDGWYGKAKHND